MAFKNPLLQLICFALVLVFGIWGTSVLARPFDHPNLSLKERHELWMARHGRVYKDLEEKEKRFNIFKKNVEFIENFNQNVAPNKLFKLGVNAFSDLSKEEFLATHTSYKRQLHSNESMYQHSMNSVTNKFSNDHFVGDMSQIQSSLDWREKGAVTAVKYQGECGCCWAFSAVAAVEGLNFIKSQQLIPLSEQELLDCVTTNNGCGGGTLQNTFAYIQSQGLVSEDEYTYQGSQSQCQIPSGTGGSAVVTINGYQMVPQNDETYLMQAVNQQPVSVGIDASGQEFMHFQGPGIFSGYCGSDISDINHFVTIIGYGTDTSGNDYWLVKNSWGETWGDEGFFKIMRNRNECGISLDAVYPTI